MKRVVSRVTERWADETNPAYPQVQLVSGVEVEIIDHLADMLVVLGKVEYAEGDRNISPSDPVTVKPAGVSVSPPAKKNIWKK